MLAPLGRQIAVKFAKLGQQGLIRGRVHGTRTLALAGRAAGARIAIGPGCSVV
jgi:hypothetical protein